MPTPHSPGYIGRLARWTRTRSAEVEGLYTSPIHPAAAAHTVAVVADLARRMRWTASTWTTSGIRARSSISAGRPSRSSGCSVLPDLTRPETATLDARRKDDVLAYADMFPQRWAAFRRARLTALVMRTARVRCAASALPHHERRRRPGRRPKP